MRPISGICGAIVATVCLAPSVRASDHLTSLMGPLVHSNITAANGAQEAVGQASETTTTAEAPKPAKPAKQHVTTQHVVESTTTVEVPAREAP